MNSKNESITTILKPWAKDSDNKDLKTFYTVDNNILRQHIETNSMTKYPVKADPTWCGRTYNSIKWIIRESLWSLSIIPSWCGRSMMVVGTIFTSNYFLRTPISQLPNYWLAESSFQDIAWNTPWHYQWPWGHKSKDDNSPIYRSMFKQYYCHMVGAFYKDEWNLEPWRGDRPMTTVFTGFQGWNAPKIFIPCNH